MLAFLQNSPVICANDNSILLATTLVLLRNIEKFKFPAKLEADRRKQIVSLLGGHLANNPKLSECHFVKAEEIGFLEKEFLSEHFFSRSSYNQAQAGEGFVVDPAGGFIATLNLQDHIQLEFIDTKGEMEQSWSWLVGVETELGKAVNYVYLPKFGFLTSDPTQCGTGLIVNAYLQVPGLVHMGTIDQVLEKHSDEACNVTGIQGSPTEIIGDILKIENNYTLGLSEESILSSIRSLVTKLTVEESAVRLTIKKEENPEFKDKVARAFGILIHSYQIEAVEALNALSIIKLGLETGWVAGIDMTAINRLIFTCRRAHLLCEYRGEKISQDEISHKRAEYIHKGLKDVALKV